MAYDAITYISTVRSKLGAYANRMEAAVTSLDVTNENMTAALSRIEDVDMAKSVEPLEEMIDFLSDELKNRHIARLREGKCTIEQGFVFSDITTNFETSIGQFDYWDKTELSKMTSGMQYKF